MFLVCAGLSGVLNLDEKALVALLAILNEGVSPAAVVETIEFASKMAKDGSPDSLSCVHKPKPVSSAKMHSDQGTRSLRTRQIVSSTVWGS